MGKILKLVGKVVATLGIILASASCNPEPEATDLEFSYATFSADEGADKEDISVYLMKSPYKFPVVVDISVEMLTGKNHKGEEFKLDQVLKFITTDESYTVTSTGDRTALIEGVEVTYTNYNKKIYFSVEDDDYLQNETITILFKIIKVEGSEKGTIDSTTLTIVDDEKAPAVKVGYYDTRYTAPADATREGRGQFYMQFYKVGKYEYVAEGLFGLPRPRLVGTFDPAKRTLTFDGTDYDHRLWAEKTAESDNPFVPVNAFQNDTIWGYAYNSDKVPTQALKLRGTVVDGKEVIMMTTEEIAENAKGVILSIDTSCGYDIHPYNNGNVGTMLLGTYDAMDKSESVTFSTTNYPTEVGAKRAEGVKMVRPLSAWQIEDINR